MDIISFLEDHLLSCVWKDGTGIDCLGCGLQRSVLLLFKGEFIASFYMFPAIYSLVLLFLVLGLHLQFNFKYGSKILLYLFILNMTIMVVNYILKFIS